MKKSLSLLCALFALLADFLFHLSLFLVLFRVIHAFSSRLKNLIFSRVKKKTWFFRETSSLFRRHSLECVFVVHPFLQKDIYIFEVVLKLSGSCLCVYDGVVRRVLVHHSFLVVVPR